MEIRKTYSASVPNVLFTVILLLLLTETPLVLFYLSSHSVFSKWIFGALCFVVAPFLAVLSFFALKIKTEITDRDVRLYRFNRNYMTIPYANHRLNTRTHRIVVEFVIPIENFFMKVTYPNGTTLDIHLHCFSRETFDKFAGDLRTTIERTNDPDRDGSISGVPEATYVRKDGYAEYGEGDLPIGGVQYTFPKNDYLKLMHHNLIAHSLQAIFLILFLAGFLALIFLSGVPMSETLLYALSAPALIALAIMAGIILILWLVYRKRTRNVPETIRITDSVIRVDDDRFSIGDIRQIKMDIIGDLRYLKIDSADRSKNYCLAHRLAGRNMLCYLDYSALYRSLDIFMRQVGKRAL
ncbi:MAG: hypothetical protein JW817_05355 [Clostridiales bacterium]|nr:hypothetical protein [Clostridiales bacterium]